VLEDFRIYCNLFRNDTIAFDKAFLMEILMLIIKPKLSEMKMPKDDFIAVLERERENPKLLYELDDDNDGYNFSLSEYKELKVTTQPDNNLEHFTAFMQERLAVFDFQLMAKCSPNNISMCAMIIFMGLEREVRPKDNAKAVETFVTLAKHSVGIQRNRSALIVFYESVYRNTFEEIRKLRSLSRLTAIDANNEKTIVAFLEELKELKLLPAVPIEEIIKGEERDIE
jgi:hypothetical protein